MPDSDELFSISGQAVLITGGSRGIGRAIAEEFSRRGASVVICSKSQTSVDLAVAEMRAAGMAVDGLVCDVADEQQIDSTVAATLELRGRIDTLVNVAGVNRRKRAETVTAEDYDHILDTNLRGAFLMSQIAQYVDAAESRAALRYEQIRHAGNDPRSGARVGSARHTCQ